MSPYCWYKLECGSDVKKRRRRGGRRRRSGRRGNLKKERKGGDISVNRDRDGVLAKGGEWVGVEIRFKRLSLISLRPILSFTKERIVSMRKIINSIIRYPFWITISTKSQKSRSLVLSSSFIKLVLILYSIFSSLFEPLLLLNRIKLVTRSKEKCFFS